MKIVGGSLSALLGEVPLNGHIFRCPNHQGFDSEKEAMSYLDDIGETLTSLGVNSWEDVCCDSCCHRVSGSFCSDRQDNLHNGYPC